MCVCVSAGEGGGELHITLHCHHQNGLPVVRANCTLSPPEWSTSGEGSVKLYINHKF